MKKIIFIFCLLAVSKVAFAASLAEVIAWKYGYCAGTRQADEKDMSADPKMVISSWKCEAPQPSEEQLKLDKQEYRAFKEEEKLTQKQDQDSVKTKLNLSDREINAIAKLIKERF